MNWQDTLDNVNSLKSELKSRSYIFAVQDKRKSKQGIFNLMTGHDLTSFFTESELDSDYKYTAKFGFQFGNGSIRIGFTGNTERNAANV